MRGNLYALVLALAVTGIAEAAADERFENEAVTLRLVAEEPDAEGDIRAALLVDLAPGWKTYWVDPGEAGIPPSIDLSPSRNIAESSLAFPAPHRFGDAFGTSNGYDGPMAVAIALRERLPGETTEITAAVTMGVCQQICVPVTARLSARPEADAAETGPIAGAFAALPAAASATDGGTEARLAADGKTLTLTTAAAGAAPETADLFVVGPKGWQFGAPSARQPVGQRLAFTLPVLAHPRKPGPEPLAVDAVLVSDGHAVEMRGIAVAGTD